MRKTRILLTVILCAALAVTSVNTSAAVVNRHSMESEEENSEGQEEKTDLNTKVETKKHEEDVIIKDKEVVDIIEPADIVFVIDSTGSMGPYIQNVADNVQAFSKYLEDKGVDVRMAVVEYKDITYDGKDSTIVHAVDGNVWHKSTAELVKTLGIVKSGVTGGGDNPETVIDALGYIVDGTTFDFGRKDTEDETHKFAIVLSDANFKENNSFGYTEKTIIEKLKEQKINTSVITSTWAHDDYLNITGTPENILNINSATFSNDLIKLADVIFKTIERETERVEKKVVESIKVTCDGKSTIKVGNYTKLNAIILPETAENKNVEWSVEDEDIASIEVSSDTLECIVTGVSEGTTKITATTEDGGFTGTYKITVIKQSFDDPAIELSKEDIKVTPAKKTINKKKSFKIKVALTKKFTEDKESEEIDDILERNIDNITFRSTRSSIASVNEDGKVTAKKKGTAIIKTTLTLADSKEYIYKTTVYVK